MIKSSNKSKKAEESDAGGDDFVLVDDDETPDSETCTWEECIACIKVNSFHLRLTRVLKLILTKEIDSKYSVLICMKYSLIKFVENSIYLR